MQMVPRCWTTRSLSLLALNQSIASDFMMTLEPQSDGAMLNVSWVR